MSHAVPLALPTTADGRPILSRADLDAYDPSPRRSGGRERYSCPIHGGDHQQSLSLDPDTGKFTCHNCGAKGTLRDFWPDAPARAPTRRAPSLEESGRRALDAHKRAQADAAARMATDTPAGAAAFLSGLDALQDDLRASDSPGAAYLHSRGLDPRITADLGAGYAAPGGWPGDRGRIVGRIVYPLGDPATGRVVSAVGRLCLDLDPSWSETRQAAFKDTKQRKLPGCPAGVWPSASIAGAIVDGRPLVLVEGPADALALHQRAPALAALALCGTAARMVPTAVLQQLSGVVLALDGDGPGAAATRELQIQCALAGVKAIRLPSDWLGDAKDVAELAQRSAHGEEGADAAYAGAVAVVERTCADLVRSLWDPQRAEAFFVSALDTLGALYEAQPEPRPSLEGYNELWNALDRTYDACDWPALSRAAARCHDDLVRRIEGRSA